MNLSNKSDYEINELVARALGDFSPPVGDGEVIICDNTSMFNPSRGGTYFMVYEDYCNDDALAFRLMADNLITITPMMSYNHATECHDIFSCWSCLRGAEVISSSKNPSRAICECFLLIKEADNE